MNQDHRSRGAQQQGCALPESVEVEASTKRREGSGRCDRERAAAADGGGGGEESSSVEQQRHSRETKERATKSLTGSQVSLDSTGVSSSRDGAEGPGALARLADWRCASPHCSPASLLSLLELWL